MGTEGPTVVLSLRQLHGEKEEMLERFLILISAWRDQDHSLDLGHRSRHDCFPQMASNSSSSSLHVQSMILKSENFQLIAIRLDAAQLSHKAKLPITTETSDENFLRKNRKDVWYCV